MSNVPGPGSIVAGCLVTFLAASHPGGGTRSATPRPTSEELRVKTYDGLTLAGTLHLPVGDGPFPSVVFTHGSEPGQRSQRGYLRWAGILVERGFAILVFDKRGVGDSEGEYVEAPDLSVPAGDLLAWVALLKGRRDIEAGAIGVLGWSQGGWVGPLAASRSPDIAFVVSISGPDVSPLEQNIFDKTNRFRAGGARRRRWRSSPASSGSSGPIWRPVKVARKRKRRGMPPADSRGFRSGSTARR